MKQNKFGIGERAISYMAWHKKEKVMCEVSVINIRDGAFLIGAKKGGNKITNNGKLIGVAPAEGRFCLWEEFVSLQNTNRKDKNGKGIYDGHIVKTTANIPVGVITQSAYGDWVVRTGSMITRLSELFENNWEVEILGHFFENPERKS